MTVDLQLFARGLVTQQQFGELVTDYDSNLQIVATALSELQQRVGVLENILNNMVVSNDE